jgi:hypothetical protein
LCAQRIYAVLALPLTLERRPDAFLLPMSGHALAGLHAVPDTRDLWVDDNKTMTLAMSLCCCLFFKQQLESALTGMV